MLLSVVSGGNNQRLVILIINLLTSFNRGRR